METHIYQKEYAEFIARYRTEELDPEEVGYVITRMAQYFSELNMKLVSLHHILAVVAQDIAARFDDNGKAITSAKAEIFTQATTEANEYNTIKAHVQNVEQYISALRALQKGMLKEYSMMSNT